jgi:hypothetical protein
MQNPGEAAPRERFWLFSVMAGLVPAIHVLLRNGLEEIFPIRICGDNRSDLPRARPMFDIVLALDGISNIIKFFEIDESLQSMALGKAFDESGAMFEYPPDEIVRHADIQDAVGAIGQNVNIPTCHTGILQDVDGRDKPGHDDRIFRAHEADASPSQKRAGEADI